MAIKMCARGHVIDIERLKRTHCIVCGEPFVEDLTEASHKSGEDARAWLKARDLPNSTTIIEGDEEIDIPM